MATAFHWQDFLEKLSKKIPTQQFRAWLEPLHFVRITDQALLTNVPTSFHKDWILDNYRETISQTLSEAYGLHLDLIVEVKEEGAVEIKEVAEESSSSNSHEAPTSSSIANREALEEANSSSKSHIDSQPTLSFMDETSSERHSLHEEGSHEEPRPASLSQSPGGPIIKTLVHTLNPKHTFETFVVGASNQFAHAAARAVAEQPASQYNPLFIYSAAGLGKTHLLHAIGNYIVRLNPKAKICYLSAEKFVNDLIESIRHEKMSQFRQKYRDGYNVLLMDDIQFIAGKDRTQEEFFHTFNALHSSHRQIVVTSDKFPKDIPGLEDRIRTRFEWGLIADIQPPEIETRIAILRAKAEMDDIFLPDEVALYLASNIKTNIRELEGALIKLGAQASLSGVEISLELVKNQLRNIIRQPSESVAVDSILEAVSHHFGLKVLELKGKERSRRIALPRQISMYLMRKYCEKSYPDIGIILGGKDHSTILHGVRAIEAEVQVNPEIRKHIEEIQNTL